MKSISEIKEMFEKCQGSRTELYESYAYDTRAGVQKLIQKYQKQDEKLAVERARLKQMRQYEEKYRQYEHICGIDEVEGDPGRSSCSGCGYFAGRLRDSVSE